MGVAAMCLLGDAAGIRRHEAIRMAGEAMMPLGATNAGRPCMRHIDASTGDGAIVLLDAALALESDESWLRQALPPQA